ncbi:uracil-DNA glycosylase [Nocardia yunnanensis]|uniref:Type-4 uracil-DNA glycosylase n=1 Tax=Nocardia yunnanensis TaxID=2382165 RepID=A0A386ZMB3_9NOCA|nr:UdgX family uracil-DNA binding protein [Nocardia yunnanensis]AYF77715.1 uracil-DNA glycosylase [Nocardia yunnanensis]
MPDAAAFVPSDANLDELHDAARRCHGCELYRPATQTVFGEGPEDAEIVLVGEQPGDQEDRQGHPFVGPAGRLLDRALDEAGIDRERVYVTNAVKHFKFTERGKRRIHQQPGRTEIVACAPWFEAELAAVRPRLVVCLGSIAAKALLGQSFRVTVDRGRFLSVREFQVLATVHPSAVLRAPDRDAAYAGFLADLKTARSMFPSPTTG